MSDENWRTEVTATDYFGHQKKKSSLADRRPLIRKASDLVGPGINAQAIRITDFNDLLAQFNGYFSYKTVYTVGNPTADMVSHNAPVNNESLVGWVSSDAELGGVQQFVSLETGTIYHRTFKRNPTDSSRIYWSAWA